MNESEIAFLSACASWLRSLPSDTALLGQALSDDALPEETRRPLAASLNYLFKSLDLIDDGIEGLGFLDDAFVLRVSVEQAGRHIPDALAPMQADADLIHQFLGPDLSARLDKYVHGLRANMVRGRSVDGILTDPETRDALLADLASWASRYEKPHFSADPKSLVKLRAFLAAKLPQ